LKLNVIQTLVRDRYEGGEFRHINTLADIRKCGDGLFIFLMGEASDAASVGEFQQRLATATYQLHSLRDSLC
jgi:hypothetical protein